LPVEPPPELHGAVLQGTGVVEDLRQRRHGREYANAVSPCATARVPRHAPSWAVAAAARRGMIVRGSQRRVLIRGGHMSEQTSAASASRDDELRRRTLRKVGARLLPYVALLYFVNYLDRTNIGF